jgi:hypothetical protein
MSETSEEHITALREEIRRASRIHQLLRLGLDVPLFAIGSALGYLTLVAFLGWLGIQTPLGLWVFLGIASIAWFGARQAVLPPLLPYRPVLQAWLRRRLQGLPREVVGEVLQTAQATGGGDTQALLGPLLRDLAASPDLIPSDAPTDRGGEPRPTG